ncbi:MAG: hemerythrin domain-containing protein [Candidatus Abawacabacteria bacterium]|nr:hemerythrin domain-containing protein [Candidatus Abawacabacteria bacterium]
MSIFTLLKADHRKIERLFERLRSMDLSLYTARHNLFQKFKEELTLHSHAEEKFFYPVLKNMVRSHTLALEAYEQHHAVQMLLHELTQSHDPEEVWEAKLEVLAEQVLHHIHEEEHGLFPLAEKALNNDQLQNIAEQIQTWRKQVEKSHSLGIFHRFIHALSA